MSFLRLALGSLVFLSFLLFTRILQSDTFPYPYSFNLTTTTNTAPPPIYSAYSDEPIALSLVMFGEDSAKEGVIAIKSALMHVSKPTELHLITSQDAVPIIEHRLKLVSRPAYDVKVFYYTLTHEQIRARANRAGVDTKYAAGLGGLAKTFIHEVIPPSVPKVLFFDTDMIFVTDPFLLWRRFDSFTPTQMIAMPDYGKTSGPMEICTCVMLLDLKAMRSPQTPFMPSSNFAPSVKPLGSLELFEEHGVDPKNPAFGDQGLYWAVWQGYPERFAHLPLSWDTSHCQFSFGMTLDGSDMLTEEEHVESQIRTYDAEEEYPQLFPGILHFNCQPDADVVWDMPENKSRKRWSSFVNLALDYKWVWLNKGTSKNKLSTWIVKNVKFADERVVPAPVGLSSGFSG